MKLLILDYFRRKGWILGLAAVLELVLGGVSAFVGGPGHAGSSAIQLQIGIFTGAFLLSFDLQRGLARTVAYLPLTVRQIGRAWWLCSVAIPTVGLSGVLFLGAGVACLFNSTAHFAANSLGMAGVFLFVIMGVTFPVMLGMNPLSHANTWQRILRGLLGGLWGAMIGGGFWFLQNLSDHPIRLVSFLSVGLIMTAFGWFRAEKLVAGRANFRPGIEARDRKKVSSIVPEGYGGISYLFLTSFNRGFGMGILMLGLMALIFYVQSDHKGWQQIIAGLEGMSVFPFWFVIFFSLMPIVFQMRALRSLPITATTLTAVLMAAILLPVLALGVLTASLIALISGTPAALNLINIYLLTLPPAMLSLSFFAWRGISAPAYGLMLFTMMATQAIPAWVDMWFHYQQLSLGVTIPIACAFVLFSFWLARHFLLHGSHAYLPLPNSVSQTGWGMGR